MNKPRKKKTKLKKHQTSKLIPFIKKFNAAAKILIRSLSLQLEQEEKELGRVKVMLNDFKLPESSQNHNISITTVDMKETKIKKKGEGSYNQVMDWEKNMRNKNKGVIL